MATKTTRITRTTDENEEETTLSGILKNLSPDAQWVCKVFRMERGVQTWLAERSPTEISEKLLAEEFGPGKYLVRPWSEADNKWAPSKVVSISANADGVNAAPAAPPSNDTAMLQLQMKMQSDSNERFITMMQANNTQITTILTSLIGAMGNNKGPDLGQLVSLVKDMSNTGSRFAEIRDMIGLAKELMPASGGGDEDITSSIVKMVLPRFLGPGAPPPPNPPVVAAAAPPPDPPRPPAAEEKPPSERAAPVEIDERLRFLNLLKDKAKSGKDVEFWADYIEDNADDPGPAWILTAIRTYSWEMLSAGLFREDPECAAEPIASWLHRLYDTLHAGEEEKPEAAAS